MQSTRPTSIPRPSSRNWRARPAVRPRPGAALALMLALTILPFAPALAQSASPSRAKPAPSAPSAAPNATTIAAPVPSEPGLTTASYGDWVLRCQRLSGDGAGRLCEVAQAVQVQGQAAPIAQLAVGRLPGQEGLRVTALLPMNVSFPSSVQVGVLAREGKETGASLDLAWRRCVPGGCLADAAAPEAVLGGWRASSEAGRIGFRDADGREVGVPVSFRGLGPALDALAKERS